MPGVVWGNKVSVKHLCLGSCACPNRSDRPSPSSATFHLCYLGYLPMGLSFPTVKWGNGQPYGLELLETSMQWPLQFAEHVASTEGVLRRSNFCLFSEAWSSHSRNSQMVPRIHSERR